MAILDKREDVSDLVARRTEQKCRGSCLEIYLRRESCRYNQGRVHDKEMRQSARITHTHTHTVVEDERMSLFK